MYSLPRLFYNANLIPCSRLYRATINEKFDRLPASCLARAYNFCPKFLISLVVVGQVFLFDIIVSFERKISRRPKRLENIYSMVCLTNYQTTCAFQNSNSTIFSFLRSRTVFNSVGIVLFHKTRADKRAWNRIILAVLNAADKQV